MKKPATNKSLATLLGLAALLPVAGGLSSCSHVKTGFQEPRIGLRPVYTLYEVGGYTRMQTPVGNQLLQGANIDTSDFGFDDEESDYGGSLTYGDGFAGLQFDYFRIDQRPKGNDVLPEAYGPIPAGANVRSKFKMDEYRLGYTLQVYEYRNEDENWWVKGGVGAMLTHQELSFHVRDVNTNTVVRFSMEDYGIPMPVAKLAAGMGPVSLRGAYSYNPDLTFGGDFSGHFQDIEITAAYELEDQNLTFFGGWRRHDLPGHKTDSGLRADVDFRIMGWFLGLEWRF